MTGNALDKLTQLLNGRVSRPEDSGYVAATSIWANSMSRLPCAVVHCREPRDVQLAIAAANGEGLSLSVRGGGHDWACRSLCNGVVLDLSKMRDVVINSDRRTARIAGGVRAIDILAATDPLGLVAVTGSCGEVGMAGFTMGGGYGPLIGRFGLGIDNLMAADVVLADGRFVTAERDRNEDLYWALRGGGGNFGVLTALQINLHELPSVISGALIYPLAEAREVLVGYTELAPAMPEELTVQIAAVAAPDEEFILLVVPTWCGEPSQAEHNIAPLRSLGTLLFDSVRPVRFGKSLSVFDQHVVNGHRILLATCSLPRLEAESIETIVRAMASAPSAGCAILTHDFKGAATRVPLAATAFGLRRDHILIEIIASFHTPTDEHRHQQWMDDVQQAFADSALPGGYPNLLGEGENERARAAFGMNAERLLAVKRLYDPGGVFRSAIPLPSESAAEEHI
ncbi:6-hydroxy-D-nicotine oxidase [Bradyrhizobium japonicum]|uniref:6-hydroxy-D-nicotine oxidase n=1 Tax=Bradyrhizobium japonicum TaxID=375 RepID=A0A0A3XLF7_BRAJP|nr:FAD-binding oxidoreductase [Bradyrhizobium japonicum]KGT75237.1 6-hydroxy-D-nicotine oxidase [Bradyrhizobium japonicum]